jgi:hypothetical protein
MYLCSRVKKIATEYLEQRGKRESRKFVLVWTLAIDVGELSASRSGSFIPIVPCTYGFGAIRYKPCTINCWESFQMYKMTFM